jgi:hypothetical protein
VESAGRWLSAAQTADKVERAAFACFHLALSLPKLVEVIT